MAPLISTQSISKSYGSRPLFTNISLTVDQDERIGLIGANGSGKSTLLRLLAGFEKPDDGEISRRRSLKQGFVAQEDSFDDGATVDSVLRSAASEAFHDEIERDTQVAVILGRVGFWPIRPNRSLSYRAVGRNDWQSRARSFAIPIC